MFYQEFKKFELARVTTEPKQRYEYKPKKKSGASEQWAELGNGYSVSSYGRVTGPSGELKYYNVQGYKTVHFNKANHLVHRLVAQAFIENVENKIEVNHIDGNKLNNHVSNLEWVTRSENMKHSYSMGLEKPPMKGRFGKLNSRSKPVLQYDLNNNFIRRFESAGEGARFLKNKSADRSISKCCNGLRKTAYGYIWRFENE